MTMEAWRRRLLELLQDERAALSRVNERSGPVEAERAYAALQRVRVALDEHYEVRPVMA